MADINCPMCGKANPPDRDVCQYCEARLKPLTDELSRSQPPIRPGEEPTDQDTGQLESVLPQWLRDIRQQARESASEDEGEGPSQPERTPQPEEQADFLAGLQSQSEGDEAVPDWLAGLRSEGGQVDFEDTASEKDDLAALKSMLGDEAPLEPAQTEPEPPASSSSYAWDADFEEESKPAPDTAEEETSSFDTELPAWLQDTDQPTQDETEGGLPAWLASEETSSLPEDQGAPSSSEGDLPGWLTSLGEEETGEAPPSEEIESAIKSTTDWLASLGEEEKTVSGPEDAQPAAEGETPAWLFSLGEESATEESTVESGGPAEEPERPVAFDLQPEETEAPATFVDDEGQPISTEDMEAIFSMDMPDWLSEAGKTSEREATPVESEAEADELRPAELPSWVQAMRPVEAVISETEGTPVEEQPVEERGPLAGLRGVLPAAPGIGPSSKPKAYSLKLQASEDQQANAAMLEQMLAEEVNPKAVAAPKVLLTQRLLRLVITTIFLSIVALMVFSGTRINPISASVSRETKAALDTVQTTLPANAPVLLVFDYEAARAGELEATAAPIVDQMLTLKAPRLTLLASTPTGSGLAERFMRILQTDRTFAREENFINLGYLPGGAAGVQAFSGNPVTTKPTTTTGRSAWETSVLQGVSRLSDFAAIILLTDDGETARIWIEQTENDRGTTPLLIISSAQSGPMIMPFVRSGQVDGMVTGLESSAPIEQANSGRPGMTRRYWDAYGFGLLAAVLMIALGSLWSMITNLQALRKGQGEG
jgi:hypothetical protein